MYVLLKKDKEKPFIVTESAWEKQKTKDLNARNIAYVGVEVIAKDKDDEVLKEKAKSYFVKPKTEATNESATLPLTSKK